MKTNKEKIYDYLMTDVYETGKIAVVTQEIAEVFGLQRSNASSPVSYTHLRAHET